MDNEYVKYNNAAELLKVLAHPVRLCLVKGLLDKSECNVTYMQSCLGVPQSTISQHLQKLKAAGVVEGRRSGLEINYSVCNKTVACLVSILLGDENSI